ncbi:MAG: CCA tRNA nucleotidyltransferase [Candidatus Iainarchaeum archaeon]|uniref:CCA-adding enzyme n=1 Tax=Candidatus Iainarchaeum sp. TaxID=3101447 RepID=A0A7T9I1U0_9ARCH|nr:MAG: CCA tRNA nucleotidyltransferase [Candidatus Diapherotrites archaeon]
MASPSFGFLSKVRKRITPSPSDARAEQAMVRRLLREIKKTKGPHLSALLCGSMARNTHLRGDRDLDIFVFYSPKLKRESFEKNGLQLAHKIFGKHFHEEVYSEHPYVRGNIDGFDVEIVPTYKVEKASDKLSAVDRTPFHAQYMRKHLSKQQCGEVRLLKQFLKGIQAYGADVKNQGVPGYLVEILILRYGTFLKAVQAMSQWKNNTVIDLEEQHSTPQDALKQFNNTHLLVIDPTDMSRNVAAALSFNQFARMIMAARQFLAAPKERFFFAHESPSMTLPQIKSHLAMQELMGIHFPFPKETVEDVMWGQLLRVSKKMQHGLEAKDYCIRRHFFWTDGQEHAFIIFDVENPSLQSSKLRIGPSVFDATHVEHFLRAHPKPLSGPRIEEGKVVLEIPRAFPEFKGALKEEAQLTAQTEKSPLREALHQFALLDEGQIIALAKKNKSFQHALSAFLKGKESFL